MAFRKSRKTIKLEKLVELVNERNRKSTCSSEVRQGWNSLLEQALMESDNYQGFYYLETKDVPKHHAPGKRLVSEIEGQFDDTDATRINYYFAKEVN